MKILVLGSEGFIGSNAVQYFQEKGHTVYSADIILRDSPFYFVINPEQPDFAALFNGVQFEYCINATGAANVQFSFAHPALDYTLNVSNVYHLLDAIRRYSPACKFINFSSAAVYGNPSSLPVSENAVIQPLSPYGLHKSYSEAICREFATYFKVPAISLRVFSAYGEGLKKQLFWDLFQKIQKSVHGEIEVFGSGNESRDFIYINDLLFAVECVMDQASFMGEVLNVASGRETSVKEAVGTFVSLVDPAVTVKFSGQEKKGDPINWVADIQTLTKMGFKARYSLEDGLGRTAAWMKKTI